MGQHGGAQELMLLAVFSSSILVMIGVYLSNHGHIKGGAVAAAWTALCLAPLLFGAARLSGYA